MMSLPWTNLDSTKHQYEKKDLFLSISNERNLPHGLEHLIRPRHLFLLTVGFQSGGQKQELRQASPEHS